MMDKKPHIKPYIYGMLAGFGAISLSILFFFFIYRFDGFGDAVSKVTGILMPFIYGAVIAYLLKPVCNTIEGFLHRIFPEKLHSMANMLAIAATLLFGVLVVYALVMMVVPQLITSVTSLYYTAQTSITRFMRWVNTQKVFLDNETLMGYFNDAYDAIADNLTALRTTLLPSLQNLQGILSGVGVGVMNVVIWFKNLLIGLIVAVYLLASRKKFAKQAKMILYSVVKPHWAQLIQEEVLYADKMFGGFINGKIMDSAIIGVLCYFACIIFKFPSALLVSVIIGVTNVIPFFGPFIGALGKGEHGRHGVEGLRIPLHHVQEPVLQVPGLFQGLPGQAIEFGVLLFAHGQRPHHGGQGCAQGPSQCRGRPAAGSRCVGAQQVRKAPYRQFRKLHDVLLIPCPPGDTPSPAYGSQNSPASGSIPRSPPGPWPGSGPPAPCR